MTLAHLVRAIAGSLIGAIIGYLAFAWFAEQGFYALAIPGAALGVGCGLSTRRSSFPTGLACGILAVLLGFLVEWRFFPFIKDGSLRYFVSHVYELKPLTLLMIAVGGILGVYFGRGKRPSDQ